MYVLCCLFVLAFDWLYPSTKNADHPNIELFVSRITHLLLATLLPRFPGGRAAEKQGGIPSPRLGLSQELIRVNNEVNWDRGHKTRRNQKGVKPCTHSIPFTLLTVKWSQQGIARLRSGGG
jgi:hypothetical protein